MVIAQCGHFWGMAAESWLDPDATEGERVHAKERIVELTSRPLTIESVEGPLWAIA